MAWWSGDRRKPVLDIGRLAELHSAAVGHWRADRFDTAVDVFEEVVDECRAQLGPDHPDSLTVSGNLAVAYVTAGRWEEGLDLLVGVVDDRIDVLGDDDPRTLTAQDALATAYRLAGRTDEATALAERVARDRARVLGPAAADTLTSRMGLALARAESGDLAAAMELLRHTLGDAERAFGSSQHRLVIALRANLGLCAAQLGQAEEAVAHYRRAATDSTALLGYLHPDTVAIYAEMADV